MRLHSNESPHSIGAASSRMNQRQQEEKDRQIKELQKNKAVMQQTINDFRISLDKKNKTIEIKQREI